MKFNFFSIAFASFFCLFASGLFAQKSIKVKGLVVENATDQAIEYATVLLKAIDSDKLLAGSTTSTGGTFELATIEPNFYVEISFIGFETKQITDFSTTNGLVDLGKIELTDNSAQLGDVVIQAEKSSTEFRLDKRVFNVGKDLSSTGASALEVLNHVPSVNVNIEGQVSLRGSQGVQILINGKPSVLASEQGKALGTITAEMIEKVEVITNPSAKYEAEGTSGIINIILKKEERRGINGSISLNTGIPDNHSVGLSLNRRTEKFNLFSQLGAGYRELPQKSRNINQDLLNNNIIYSSGTEYRNEGYYTFILGSDYYINPNNVITLSGNYAFEDENQPSRFDFYTVDSLGAPMAEWYRNEVTTAGNPKFQYELQYKRDFKDHKEHDLIVSALGNFFGKDQSSVFENVNVRGDEAAGNQLTRTNFNESKYTFKLDYTRPFSKKFTLESGAQYLLNDVGNDFAVEDFINGAYVENATLTNVFEYTQNVLGVYSTAAYENDKWGFKGGLRLENTDLSTLLVNTQEENKQNFNNLFPSAHATYKINQRFSVQSGYSRRIFRPRLWDLNPFFNIRNNFSIRTGNPNLLPEYTDSYELTGIYILDKISLNFGSYYRFTTEVVERVSTFSDNVSTTIPMNIGTNRTTGIEVNGKYTPNKWLGFTGDFNYNIFNRKGVFEATSFDFNGDRWSGKLTTKVKLPAQLDVEITGQYESRYKSIQNTFSDMLFADLGIRKKIFKGKAILNLSVRDLFASRISISETQQPSFYLYNWDKRGRFVTLGFSYGFGKGEAMEFSGQKRH